MKVKRDIILKMQKEMAEHKDMAGDCDFCPKHLYMNITGKDVWGDSCLEECGMILDALGIKEHIVENNGDGYVRCDDFFFWFLGLKLNKRKVVKI